MKRLPVKPAAPLNVARVIIWGAIAVMVGYDVYAVTFRKATISAQVRAIDAESGSLFRWLLMGLCMHFFVGMWPKFRGSDV